MYDLTLPGSSDLFPRSLPGKFWDLINCSQMRFVAIILCWSFYAIFCLTDLSSEPFDLSSSKTGKT